MGNGVLLGHSGIHHGDLFSLFLKFNDVMFLDRLDLIEVLVELGFSTYLIEQLYNIIEV